MYFAIRDIDKLTEASVQINGKHSDWFIVKEEVRRHFIDNVILGLHKRLGL